MEEVKEDTRQEGIKVTKEAGARTIRAAGSKEGEVTRGIQEEVKEDMETQRGSKEEVKEDTKEEVKEGTKDGTRRAATRRRKGEVKAASFPTANETVTGVAVKGISPRTAPATLTRSGQAQGGQLG